MLFGKTLAMLQLMKLLILFVFCLVCLNFSYAKDNHQASSTNWDEIGPHYKIIKGCKLAAPPQKNSKAEKSDFEILFHWQKHRTNAEYQRALSEAHVTFKSFFGQPNGLLSENELKILDPIFEKVMWTADVASHNQKQYWKRLRPFVTKPQLETCTKISKRSLSYPSGHATIAVAEALVLSKFFPERLKQLIERANEIGLDRVICAVHHPSDIEAGRECGKQVYEQLLKNQEFLLDVKKAREALPKNH